MPVKELAALLQPEDRAGHAHRLAAALPRLHDRRPAGAAHARRHRGSAANGMPPDNWIYIQEPDVKLGRLQVFNNWSPALVADPATIWLGLEYFCAEGDELWSMADGAFLSFAAAELAKIGLIARAGCAGRHGGARAQGLSGLLRRLQRDRPGARLAGHVHQSVSRSAATACTATTTRIIRCWRPRPRWTASSAAAADKSALWADQYRRGIPRERRAKRQVTDARHLLTYTAWA